MPNFAGVLAARCGGGRRAARLDDGRDAPFFVRPAAIETACGKWVLDAGTAARQAAAPVAFEDQGMLMKSARLLLLFGCAPLLALGSLGKAQTGQPPEPNAIPGIDQLSGHLAELVPTCVACHGENGVPNYADSPIIDGQHENYLYIQLRDYKNGSRKHEVMNEIVKELSRQDMRELAKFFARRPWPRVEQSAEEGDDVVAERLARTGLCKECHLPEYVGDSTVPRLAGQLTTYLVVTMRALKTKERDNNAAMSNLLDTFEDEEIDALARYLGSL